MSTNTGTTCYLYEYPGDSNETKAIIVSGFSKTERVNETHALRGEAYIKKPYIIEISCEEKIRALHLNMEWLKSTFQVIMLTR